MTFSDILEGLRWASVACLVVGFGLLLVWMTRPQCSYLTEKLASYEACKIDMNCKLTAKDHYEWIRFQRELEACHE